MKRAKLSLAVAGMVVSAAVAAALWPHARDAFALLAAQDDPAELSSLQVNSALRNNPGLIRENVEAALAAGDADLAGSFAELALDRNVALGEELSKRVSDAVTEDNSSAQFARRFATGLVTGNADDIASLSGTVAGDLFVWGDIRDVVREGKHLAMGEETDHLILGLATVGLAVTAATYVSVGGAVPLRAGLTLVKDTRKVGRLSEGLVQFAGRSAREVVDAPVLQRAVASGSVLRPGETIGAMKAAFRAEKAGVLVRLAKDVGRVGEKAGIKAAQDTLKIAESPKEVARAARLAEKKGGQTRAILKTLGRGALLGLSGLWTLASWIFSVAMAVLAFLASIKATTERLTYAWLRRKKAARARRLMAAQQAPLAVAPAAV
ncbi:hypothetical protein [Bradyrhizobium sp.]|uniref:hypothetical protein n=1 Tax=Bradyrhizobium sp. TaxID=376 RepID=UPI001E17AB49|nr:hypothetical protein [Bradyrhizobium sp.]MBI5323433.1 hypothetical protein [Bradyrhizobium sp.]